MSFKDIWDRYPRKMGKKAAEKHFNSSVKTKEDFLNIEKSLDKFLRYLSEKGTEEEFIPHGSTWFNNWEDWLHYEPPKAKKDKYAVMQDEYEKKYGDMK